MGAKIFEHISNTENRANWNRLQKTGIPRDEMYYYITEEEDLYTKLRVTKPRKYSQNDDFKVLEYKARSAVQWSRLPYRSTL